MLIENYISGKKSYSKLLIVRIEILKLELLIFELRKV